MDKRGVPSVSIALVKGDEVVWTEAFGYANVRTKTAATPDTIYSTGSTFKPVTATALVQLVEQGKCSLDDPVNQHLGDIYLTAEDMVRSLGAQINGGVWGGSRILSEESVREMHTAQFGGYYSLGFAVKKAENGHTVISHSGAIGGQNSVMMGDVDARVGVYMMSNSGVPSSLGEAAIQLLRGEDYTPLEDREYIDVDPEILATYAGKYDLAGRYIFEIVVENDGLFVIMPRMGKSELLAETESRFWLIGEGWVFNFVAGDEGSIDRIDFESDGLTMHAERIEE